MLELTHGSLGTKALPIELSMQVVPPVEVESTTNWF